MEDGNAASQLRRAVEGHVRDGQVVLALQQLDGLIGLGAAGPDDWLLTGNLLCRLGEFAQALGAFENCLQGQPASLEARYELGRALYKLGDADGAAAHIEQVARTSDSLAVWMGLATIAPGVPMYDQQRVRHIREKFAGLLRAAELPELGEGGRPRSRRATTREGERTRRLRVGYLSAHWHDANYMKPVWPLVNAQNRQNFEVFLFDDGPQPQPNWQWLNSEAQVEWIGNLGNADAAAGIAEMQLDILVDLSAYSQPERLGVFVHRPAPIQIAWFNMYATSGLAEFDYIVGDRWVVHSHEQRHYTERCLQLPISYLTFRTNHAAPEVVPAPSDAGGPFTFGCLGTLYKLTPLVLDAWSEILLQAPQAELLLSCRELKSPCNQQYILGELERRGVAPHRIRIAPPAPHYQFLEYYSQIDVALDTFPYNGGTTTMEAIWQGVPVLNMAGDRWVARTSRSLLCNTPWTQYCVENRQDYVRTAVRLATDSDAKRELSRMRLGVREQLLQSKVCDVQLLATKLEGLYRKVVRGC